MMNAKKLGFLASAAVMLTASGAYAKTTIGVAMSQFDDNFLTVVREAMAAAAKAKDVSIQFQDAQTDAGRQLNQIQNFISQKVDAIIVNPADTSATKKMTEVVNAAGIPLVYVNRGPDAKKLPDRVSVVASDHVVSGRLEMEELAKKMGGKGNVVIMLGELASNATQERTTGNKEVIAKFPNIKIIEEQTANYQRAQAIDLMTNWLTKGLKIDGVVANNDEMAIGALIAIRQAGKSPKDIKVGGIDATSDALAEMDKGDLAVTVFQNAKGQGGGAVDAALKMIKGEKVDSFIMIPYELVSDQNYKQYMDKN